MKIYTEQFQFVHGRKPKGTGCWAFVFSNEKEEWCAFAPSSMSYTEASKWIKEETKRNGWKASKIEVGA